MQVQHCSTVQNLGYGTVQVHILRLGQRGGGMRMHNCALGCQVGSAGWWDEDAQLYIGVID